ncbi:MAG: response regulator transcription factor [Asticcacaulis sp.]
MKTASSPTQRGLRKLDYATTSVLIVEDNDASRRLITELLRAAGFNRLTFAHSAEDAIDHLKTQAPDLMLLDWNLPGMSGLELATQMRLAAVNPDSRFPNPQMPLIMLTARQSAHDVTLARNAGITEFVIKPFSTTALLKAIGNALSRKSRSDIAASLKGTPRHKRKAGLHPGLLADPAEVHLARNPLSREIESLRETMRTPGLDREQLNLIVLRLMHTQTVAHDLRMRLIERATQSLNTYMRLFGDKAEAEVLDVHMDALIRLNEAQYTDPDEAIKLVKNLNTLVNKRKTNRKVAP